MSGFWLALRSDAHLALRSRWLQATALVPAAAAAARVALGKLRAVSLGARGAILGQAPAASLDLDGYGAFADGLSTGLTIAYIVLVAVAAYSCASDREQGVVRHLLVTRIGRTSYALGRYAFLTALGLAVCALAAAAAWAAAALLYDFSPAVEDGYELIGVAEIHAELLRGAGLALTPLPAAIALGLLISLCARSPAGAVSIALGATLGFDIFKGALGDLARYAYAFYHPSLLDGSYLREVSRLVRGFSDVFVEEAFFQRNLWLPWPQALLLLAAAVLVARRREM